MTEHEPTPEHSEADFPTAAHAWLSIESFHLMREYRDRSNALTLEFHKRLTEELRNE